jgi:hypothetical protein
VPLVLAALGCAGVEERTSGGLDGTTTKRAVVRALEGTGYGIAYRKTGRVPGYDVVAGQARSRRGGVVEFSVVVDRSAAGAGRMAQPPVVRYAEGGATKVGNAVYHLQGQSPYVVRNLRNAGRSWVEGRGETKMQVRLTVALDRLFAPRFRGQG